MLGFLLNSGSYIHKPTPVLVIDILVIISVLLMLFFFFKTKRALRVFVLLLIFAAIYTTVNVIVAVSLGKYLYITKRVFDYVLIFLIFSLCFIYQNDIKLLYTRIAKAFDLRKVEVINATDDEIQEAASEIVKACQQFSKKNVGALLIIVPRLIPDFIRNSGTELQAKVSAALLESIFSTKGPIHDGATVIKGTTVVASGCFLPNSESTTISPELGTRHRAAIGATEKSDVVAVVVSEENGVISIAQGGRLKRYLTPEQLNKEVVDALRGDFIREEDDE